MQSAWELNKNWNTTAIYVKEFRSSLDFFHYRLLWFSLNFFYVKFDVDLNHYQVDDWMKCLWTLIAGFDFCLAFWKHEASSFFNINNKCSIIHDNNNNCRKTTKLCKNIGKCLTNFIFTSVNTFGMFQIYDKKLRLCWERKWYELVMQFELTCCHRTMALKMIIFL